MSRALAPALLLASGLVAAGCVSVDDPVEAASADPALVQRLVAFGTDALPVEVPAILAEGLGVVPGLVGHRGAEPNVGVTSTGVVFTTAGHNTLRSTDQGRSWEVVFNLSEALPQTCEPLPDVPTQGCPIRQFTRSSDPMLWVDPVTDRVFTNHMTGSTAAT